jgi:hypothetical protein
MESLWLELAFFVIDTDAPLDAVLASLPVRTVALSTAPRRFALAQDIHEGLCEPNYTELAAFQEPGLTVIAPPSSVFLRTGEDDWPRALSRLGTTWAFAISENAPRLAMYVGGERVANLDDLGAEPAGAEILGISSLDSAHLEPLFAALARLLGTADVKQLLRTGTCTQCRADEP